MPADTQSGENTFTSYFNSLKGSTNASFFNSSSTKSGVSNWFNSTSSSSSWFGSSSGSSGTTMSVAGQIITYILAVIIVTLFILILVHFFITPIFQLHPGGPGVIPVPGGDDGKMFWNKGLNPQILDADLPINGISWGYTLMLDTFIQNPLQFSNKYRILCSRGAVRKSSPTGTDTFLGILDTYNIVVALDPNTNDLIISLLSGTSTTKHEENVIIPNVPVQKVFRLGIVVMERALEVYINGNLVKTRKYDYSLQNISGPIDPATPEESTIATFQMLKVWNRILSTSEMRYAKPALKTSTPFGALQMPSSISC
jgi:hypothetical protein